jgi:hypothetical protein
MAAVRPLGAKARTADSLAAVPPPPSLAERLAKAQRAAEGPARRAGELDAALKDALAREDFAAAQILKDELAEARQEAAIASAAVTGLEAAIAEIGRQQAEDSRAIQEQQHKAEARIRCDAARRREMEADEELEAAIAAVLTGLEAVRRTYRRALELEHEVGRARAEVSRAREILGEIPPGIRTVSPNKASVMQDDQAVLRELMKWAGPPHRTPPPVVAARPFSSGGLVQPSPWR